MRGQLPIWDGQSAFGGTLTRGAFAATAGAGLVHSSRPLLVHQPGIQGTLRRIALSLTQDEAMLEDLAQEALIHLWQRETQQPGQTSCWYLQSCKFHLRDVLDRGRSVDSWKHRARCIPMPAAGDRDRPDWEAEQQADESLLSLVISRDMLQELAFHLPPAHRVVLDYLAAGFSVEEIASELHCSHQSVSKRRRRIAQEATELGFRPAAAPARSALTRRGG
ncbi:MAG TPA: sigma-70 family RNA polymerase sigma factor [Candidatus Acidoferrum sp.]|nr:sigma-70 family RNA polymerase sigma factor [Candidatus Acidoferrum sp.]